MTIEDIILEILDEMDSVTGSYVEPMDIDPDMEPEVITTEGELDEKITYSLDRYKKEVKKALKDKSLFDDQLFYEDMVDAFTSGISPAEFVMKNEAIEELNSTATTGDMAYNTPGAFRKTDGTEDEEESGFNDGHKDPEVLGYKKAKVSKRNFESEFKKIAKEMFVTEGITHKEIEKNFPIKDSDIIKFAKNAAKGRDVDIDLYGVKRPKYNDYGSMTNYSKTVSINLKDAGQSNVAPSGTLHSKRGIGLNFHIRAHWKEGKPIKYSINASKNTPGGMSVYNEREIKKPIDVLSYMKNLVNARDNKPNTTQPGAY